MKKVKAFFYVFKNSLLNPQYYKELLNVDMNFSIKYYAFLVVFMSFLSSLIMGIKTIPPLQTQVNDAAERAKKVYPDDLVITFMDDTWSINKEEPFIIPTPIEDIEVFIDTSFPEGQIPKNLIILNKEGTISDLEEQDSMILVNKNNIIIRTQDNIESFPLKETLPMKRLSSYQITKNEFVRLIDISRRLPLVLPLIAFFSGILGLAITGSVEAIIVSVILLIYTLLTKMVINFQNLFKISLHTATLILCLQLLLGAFDYYAVSALIFWFGHVLYGVIVLAAINRPEQS